MKTIKLPVSELKSALPGLGKLINKKSTLPVLATILVSRDSHGWITLTTTDLDTFATVRMEVPAEQNEATEVIVPFLELSRLVKNAHSTEQIVVHSAEKRTSFQYLIAGQLAQLDVTYLEPQEYPESPKIIGEAARLDGAIRSSILEAYDCISHDETRYVLNGVCLDVSNEKCHCVVATNGRQLYSSNSFRIPVETSLILPDRTKFLRWKPFSDDGEWQILANPKSNHGWIKVSSRRWTYYTKEIDGNYPNWRQVLPDANCFRTRVSFTPEAIENMRQVIPRLPCRNPEDKPLTLVLANGQLHLRASVPVEEKLVDVQINGVKVSGRPITICLNWDYFMTALKMGLDRADFCDSTSPVLLSNAGRQMVVMPMRLSETTPPPDAAVAETEATKEPVPVQPEPIHTPEPDASPQTEEASEIEPVSEEKAEPPVSTLDQASEAFENLREHLQDGVARLKDLAGLLKQIQREQKTSTKEMQAFRSRLRELQALKI